jgi:hypothetical protein
MANHDRITFTAEYCRARRIPYRVKREALFISGKQVCYSLYNLTYSEILRVIDDFCEYDQTTTFFAGLK